MTYYGLKDTQSLLKRSKLIANFPFCSCEGGAKLLLRKYSILTKILPKNILDSYGKEIWPTLLPSTFNERFVAL